jgi:hypothetical protein
VNYIENHEKGMKHEKKKPENRIKKERKWSTIWNDGWKIHIWL